MKKIVGILTFLGSVVVGALYAEDRFNQEDAVLNVSETVRLHAYEAHSYHYDDISLRIVYLASMSNRDSNQERELLMYQERQKRLRIKLERLNK
jgi:hypothetical protein